MSLAVKHGFNNSILEMLTASVENMMVTSINTTLETSVAPTQYIVIISTVRRQSEVGIQHWIHIGPIVNFCLSCLHDRIIHKINLRMDIFTYEHGVIL